MPAAILPAGSIELGPLRMMASRIARNREVAGVHYPSDSFIGRKLADSTFSIMMKLPTIVAPSATGSVPGLITAAQLEWAPR
jgi:hypothetical protein